MDLASAHPPNRSKAEFLLSNAVDADDYTEAVRCVREMGLDPEEVPHEKPADA